MFKKKTIVKKTAQVSLLTLLSRFFGIIREFVFVRYLGASALADAFFTAYKVPNMLRKVFAEGALSAATVPVFSRVIRKNGKKALSNLVTLSFCLFEFVVLLLCALIMYNAHAFILLIVPGFSVDQVDIAAQCLTILMPFIFFISSNALLAGALHTIGHFFMPVLTSSLFNLVFIGGLLVCYYLTLPVTTLCWFVLAGGAVQFLVHVITFYTLGFCFTRIDWSQLTSFKEIFFNFIVCLPSASITEINLFVDTSFASLLPAGSISLLRYAFRFMGIPLGVFAIAFARILLPQFSRVRLYAPKRLHYYLLESIKVVFWVMLPVSMLMSFFADKFFETLFLSEKFTYLHVSQAANLLSIFLFGLFSFSVNRIIVSIYYAMQVTWVPGVIAAVSALFNVLLDWLLIYAFQAQGIAIATTGAAIMRTFLLLGVLYYWYDFKGYPRQLASFFIRYIGQFGLLFVPFYSLFKLIEYFITKYLSSNMQFFLLNNIGFWLWICPLMLFLFFILWSTRRWFGLSVYFLDDFDELLK
jgi:putative peptidoglycan lipid II flippase